jgi:uncharacterized membrane protein
MKFRNIVAALALVLTVGIFHTPLVHADVNNFTITHFSSDQTLSRNDAQGSLHIIESIDVTFTDNNHGIIRAIPDDYNSQPLHFHLNKVTSNSGAPTDVSQSFSNGNVVLKIGNPNRTVTGAQNYVIDYTVENVISFYSDHDELYWDVNGDQWTQPASAVDVKLHLPSGLTLSQDVPQCYMGAYNEAQRNCAINHTGSEVDSSVNNVPAGQTLTYVVGFTKGYFQPQTTTEKVKDNLNPLLSLIVLPIAALIGGFMWWWRKGRDVKGRGVIVPEYEPPKGILPIEAGTLLDFKTDNRDITATLIDLALKGYVRIHETVVKRRLMKDKLQYELELLKPDFSSLSSPEARLLNGLFSTKTAGEQVELGKIDQSFVTAVASVRKSVSKDLKTRGYIAPAANKYGIYLLAGVAVIATILAFAFGKKSPENIAEVIFGAIMSVVAISVFWFFMTARTAEGTAIREQLLGLKMYMELTEKDRIAMLQAPNAPYAEKRDEPKRTVELFEKLLPYAIIMGVEKQWAKQFESIYTTPPGWYNGNASTFNSMYIASSLNNNFGQAISTSFTPPSSSGSSGLGGGGFSGGGGGGGGGGGW